MKIYAGDALWKVVLYTLELFDDYLDRREIETKFTYCMNQLTGGGR